MIKGCLSDRVKTLFDWQPIRLSRRIIMSSIDKNDVDISKLFQWYDKFELKNGRGESISVWMRLPGDAEINQARVFALRHSKEFRAKLRNPETDEAIAYIPEFDELTHEQLADFIARYQVVEFTREALDVADIPYPKPLPSDATMEEQEKFQEEVDTFDERRDAVIRVYVDNKIDVERSRLMEKETEKLQLQLRKLVIDKLCEDEMLRRYKEYIIYVSSFKDDKFKERLFNAYEDFENLSPSGKAQLAEFYNALELGNSELKK